MLDQNSTLSTPSQIVFIRHGEPKCYAAEKTQENPLDLTQKGIAQVQDTCQRLYFELQRFDQIIMVSSPAVRAEGTAEVFVDEFNYMSSTLKNRIGVKHQKLIINKCGAKSMRPMDIYNFSAYKKYMEENSTDVYGELWLTGKDHAQSNNFVESRHSVEKRSFRLLEKYSNFLKKKSLNGKVPTCILLFNHFEIGTPILKGLYTEKNIFPSAKLKYSCGELKNLPDVFPQDYAEPICIIPGQGLYFYKIVAPFRQLNRNVYALEKERRFMQLS